MTQNLEHLLTIARRGKHAGASGGEKQARKLVKCVLDNALGLDASASVGITELIDLVQSQPMDGREAVREATGIK